METATMIRPATVRTTASTASREVARHRADVVRRLLARGVSPRTLALLLPEWMDTIEGEAAHA